MTSDEINAQVSDYDPDTTGGASAIWLKEIAYQLAVLNERKDVPKLKHNPFGEVLGSPVSADSDKPLRGGHQEDDAGVPGGIEPYCRWCRLIKRDWEASPECPANPAGRFGADSDKTVRGSMRTIRRLHSMLANVLRPIMSDDTAKAGFSDWLADAIEQQFILIDKHDADERTTRPDPQTASIQPQNVRVPDDSSEI
jgi:hypothetical protein